MNNIKTYLAHNESVRVVIIDATEMIQNVKNMHNLSNVATAALGRTMMISSIMCTKLKNKENKLTVQIKGDGKLGGIVVCGNGELKIKGYVNNPDIELPLKVNGKLDVSTAVGKGNLFVIKDIGLKDPYSGNIELISSEIAEDFAYYFAMSEQTPSVVSLGVNIGTDGKVQKACGYIIEPLPDCDEKVIDILEIINSNIDSVTNLAIDLESIEDVVKTITGDENILEISSKESALECDCSRGRIESVIIALGKKETIKSLEKNNDVLEINCNFCDKKYSYCKEDIEKIFI